MKRTNVEIVRVDSHLDGIAYIDGSIIKVPYTQVGDIVDILETNVNKSIPIATKVNISSYSSNRNTPICPHYSVCGGCKGQHFPKADYIDIKLNSVKQSLSRLPLGEFDLENIIFVHHLDSPRGHRRRATFSVKSNKIGFKEYRSNNIAAINHCPILSEKINEILEILSGMVAKFNHILRITEVMCSDIDGKIDVLITSEVDTNIDILTILGELFQNSNVVRVHWRINKGSVMPLIIKSEIFLDFNNYKVKFSAGGFLQAEKFGEENILKILKEYCNKSTKVLDLFCGFGSYSFNLLELPNIEKIVAMDITGDSINAINKTSNSKRLVAFKRDIMKEPLSSSELDCFDSVIINPPRVGARSQSFELAKTSSVNNIFMVYCSVSSMSRDLSMILQSDKFMVKSIFVLDQFIFSEHMEVLVSLQNVNK